MFEEKIRGRQISPDEHTSIQLTGKRGKSESAEPYSEKANDKPRDYTQVGEPENKKLPVNRPQPRSRSGPRARDCCDYFHLVSPFDRKAKMQQVCQLDLGII
jgi:hypothetical protein